MTPLHPLSMNAPACLFLTSLFLFSSCSQQNNRAPYSLTLDASGIGRINEQTPFDPSALSAMLPGFEITAFTTFREGEGYPLLRVMRGSDEWMVIQPTADRQHIRSITLRTPHIWNAEGVTIGSALQTVYSEKELSFCRPGSGELAGFTVCRSKKTPHILYHYVGAKGDADAALAPYTVLKSWRVEEIVWKP
jgi:hypothetical protein